MTYNRAGTSGLKLPAVSLGFWHNFGDITPFDQMKSLVFTAFDNGITHFDLANNYGPEPGAAEKNAGRLIRQYLAAHRDELVISTKAGYEMWSGPYGDWGSRKYLLASLDQSLERLGLDYVDIFYHHRPDPETPLEETMGALAQAVASGKALYVGLSNYDGPQLSGRRRSSMNCTCRSSSTRTNTTIFDRTVERNGLKDTAKHLGKGLITFCPLAQGLLTGKYRKGQPLPAGSRATWQSDHQINDLLTDENLDKVEQLRKVADELGTNLPVLSMAWILQHPEISCVIAGASKPSQLENNMKAAGFVIPADAMAEIDKITGFHRFERHVG